MRFPVFVKILKNRHFARAVAQFANGGGIFRAIEHKTAE